MGESAVLKRRASGIFYGWVIVIISLVSITLIYGMRHSFSVFFPFTLDEFETSLTLHSPRLAGKNNRFKSIPSNDEDEDRTKNSKED